MTQNKQNEIEYFNSHITMWKSFSKHTFNTIFDKEILSSRSGKAFDIGCGNGIFAAHLALVGFEVVGVDISISSLRIAKKLSHAHNLEIEFIQCDVEKLPIRSDSFDVCVCGGVFHHFPFLDIVAKQISFVTKNKGKLVAFEPNGSNPFARIANNGSFSIRSASATSNERALTFESLEKILYANGFKNFNFSSLNSLYPPPFSRDDEKLWRKLTSFLFFYMIVPAAAKFLAKFQRGFYFVLSCNKL
jgi:ubiquinone/menaquinone biosynthesis C-methylase UbiE